MRLRMFILAEMCVYNHLLPIKLPIGVSLPLSYPHPSWEPLLTAVVRGSARIVPPGNGNLKLPRSLSDVRYLAFMEVPT
jgi:hypothetical protein